MPRYLINFKLQPDSLTKRKNSVFSCSKFLIEKGISLGENKNICFLVTQVLFEKIISSGEKKKKNRDINESVFRMFENIENSNLGKMSGSVSMCTNLTLLTQTATP